MLGEVILGKVMTLKQVLSLFYVGQVILENTFRLIKGKLH